MRLPQQLDRDRRRGFTIIELVIVIAIIALLAALGGPALQAWIWKARLNEATRNVERKMNTARKLSMATRVRHCVRFTSDPQYANGGPDYSLGVTVSAETAPNSMTWTPVTAPPELAGWTNDQTTELFEGVSLEAGVNTTVPTGTDNCAGFLFNTEGFLANPTADFTNDCDGLATAGALCAMLTLRQKALDEQRTLWVDRAGGVRISAGPSVEPAPPT